VILQPFLKWKRGMDGKGKRNMSAAEEN
jgi:hypothetical protein